MEGWVEASPAASDFPDLDIIVAVEVIVEFAIFTLLDACVAVDDARPVGLDALADAVDFSGEALSFLLADAPAGINGDDKVTAADALEAGKIIAPPEMTPCWFGERWLLAVCPVEPVG